MHVREDLAHPQVLVRRGPRAPIAHPLAGAIRESDPRASRNSVRNRQRINVRANTCDTALGITSRTPQEASPQRVLAVNRGHWSIESVHNIIDWNYDEDRGRIRTGFGPENITRLRRFAVGILKSFQKSAQSIAEIMRKLAFNTRLVFDYLRMTQNSTRSRAL